MTTAYPNEDCWFCIDGNEPAGGHDILGEVYRTCPFCRPTCPVCEGEARWPSLFHELPPFAAYLATFGLAARFCPDCRGVTDLVPLHHTPTEVSHDHH